MLGGREVGREIDVDCEHWIGKSMCFHGLGAFEERERVGSCAKELAC